MSVSSAQAPSHPELPPALRLVADQLIVGDGTLETVADGAVDIGADGRIVAVGPESELTAAPSRRRRVGGLLAPGLINAHAHTPMTLMRSAGDGLALDRWLADAVWPREAKMTPDDAWWGMALGSIEMLRAGVTSSVEMYLFEDEIADAVQTTGARVHLSAAVIAALMADGQAFEDRLDAIGSFHGQCADLDRIAVGFGPHSAYDLDPAQLAMVAEAALERGATVHIHLEETRAERDLVQHRYGKTATQVLADAGVLEADVLAAHAVWLDDTDRRLLAEAGAAVAHCPQSNLKLGSGIADVPAMLYAGIAVGVATDGPASNDNLDLWEELRLAPLLARGRSEDAQAMTAAQAFALATSMGARAARLPEVGELRPGAWADLIRLDLDQPAMQPALPDEVGAHLVWAAGSALVTDVWVAGDQVVDGGECTRVDRRAAQHEVATRARRLAGC